LNQELNDQMNRYIVEVLRFSRALSLTSVNSKEEFYRKFISPSLKLLPSLPASGRLLDVGSGMGIPGVPILLGRPALHGVLVERRRKRAEFLRHLKRLFGLNAEIYAEDLRDLPCLNADACVARAVCDVDSLLDMYSPHVHDGAVAVLAVPRTNSVVSRPGWRHQHDLLIEAGRERQAIQIYRYRKVSRET